MANKKIEIYTDGACSGNPGQGAFCSVLTFDGHRKEIIEKYNYTTNNRMELLGVVAALESLKVDGWDVIIYSDSKYVVDSVEKGWVFNWVPNFTGKANKDLWERFLNCYYQNKIKFVWVKGHASNEMNNYCDIQAVNKRKDKTEFLIDYGYINK